MRKLKTWEICGSSTKYTEIVGSVICEQDNRTIRASGHTDGHQRTTPDSISVRSWLRHTRVEGLCHNHPFIPEPPLYKDTPQQDCGERFSLAHTRLLPLAKACKARHFSTLNPDEIVVWRGRRYRITGVHRECQKQPTRPINQRSLLRPFTDLQRQRC